MAQTAVKLHSAQLHSPRGMVRQYCAVVHDVHDRPHKPTASHTHTSPTSPHRTNLQLVKMHRRLPHHRMYDRASRALSKQIPVTGVMTYYDLLNGVVVRGNGRTQTTSLIDPRQSRRATFLI
jgi:hypothetical protein